MSQMLILVTAVVVILKIIMLVEAELKIIEVLVMLMLIEKVVEILEVEIQKMLEVVGFRNRNSPLLF